MKSVFIIIAFAFIPFITFAQQEAAPAIGCIDKDIVLRIDDVKHGFIEKGMKVFKDAMVSMESETPYSIEVKLEKGHLYQLLYMGSEISSKSSIELFDGDDKSVMKKEIKRGEEPGYITFDYTPTKTDIYLIVLQQKQKHASMCGSFSILERTQSKN